MPGDDHGDVSIGAVPGGAAVCSPSPATGRIVGALKTAGHDGDDAHGRDTSYRKSGRRRFDDTAPVRHTTGSCLCPPAAPA